MTRIILTMLVLGVSQMLIAQSTITGKLISVESRVFPHEYFVIFVQDGSGKIQELRIDDRIMIKNERLLLYTVSEFTNYFLTKEEEPAVFYRNKFLYEDYEFAFTNKLDGGRNYLHCTQIKPYEPIVHFEEYIPSVDPVKRTENVPVKKPVERVKINSFSHINSNNSTFYQLGYPLLNINSTFAMTNDIDVLNAHYSIDSRKIVSAIKSTVNTYENFSRTNISEWNSKDDTLRASVRIFVSSINVTEEIAKAATASKFISKVLLNVGTSTPTKGHVCKISVNVLITPGPYTKPFNITISATGGKPIQQLDIQAAYQQAITELQNKLYSQLTYLFPPYTEDVQQKLVSKLETKTINIYSVGRVLNPKIKYGVILFTDDHFNVKDGVIKFKSYLSKGRIETIIDNANASVKITEGGEALKLKLDRGEKIRAVVYPLSIVESWR